MNDDKARWQLSSDPKAPAGYRIRCTGCSLCARDGHLPMQDTQEPSYINDPDEYRRIRDLYEGA